MFNIHTTNNAHHCLLPRHLLSLYSFFSSMEFLSSEIVVMERLFISTIEAFALQISITVAKSLASLLFMTGSLLNVTAVFHRDPILLERLAITELNTEKQSESENKDASEDDDEDNDEDEDEVEDELDNADAVEGGEEEDEGNVDDEEGDPDDEPEANGDGGSGEDEDEDEDDDENEEEEEEEEDDGEEEEEEEDEEIPQPPTKKRK